MPYVKRARKSARRPAIRRRRAAPRRMVSNNVKNFVKNTLHRQLENKQYVNYVASTIISSPYTQSLMPTLVQGTGSSQRMGNKVRIMSSNFRCIVRLNPYNSTLNPNPTPSWVKIFIVSQKIYNLPTFSGTDFFQINNSSQTFTGQNLDMLFPVNTDVFTVHKTFMFRLGTTSASNNFPGANTIFDNSVQSKYLNIPLGKYYKSLKFDDTASNIPTNHNLWFVIQATPCNSLANGSNQASIDWVLDTRYEDA